MHRTHNPYGKLPLDEIEAFVEVASAGSFSAAANRLNMVHSSLSRKVAHLEDRIGIKLLERKANGVHLTEQGVERFLRFRDALGLITSLMHRLDPAGGNQTIRVSTLDSFAIYWLFPRHAKLQSALPDLNIRYEVDIRLVSFSEGIDLAIRFGLGTWPDSRAIRLHALDYRPMANRALAEMLGPAATAEALHEHPLIHLKTEISWLNWFEAQGISYRLRPQDRVFQDLPTLLAAVENGLGLGLSRLPYRHLVDGTGPFAHVSEHTLVSKSSHYLVRDDTNPLRVAARRFAEAFLADAGIAEADVQAFLAD
ncbi:MAG: LysR family transcriptional regulator [Beijerinckiaceae bacterium]|nr:MAG: LysR family transcriptional regulator [Beijerinckiaceae bacterium]